MRMGNRNETSVDLSWDAIDSAVGTDCERDGYQRRHFLGMDPTTPYQIYPPIESSQFLSNSDSSK